MTVAAPAAVGLQAFAIDHVTDLSAQEAFLDQLASRDHFVEPVRVRADLRPQAIGSLFELLVGVRGVGTVGIAGSQQGLQDAPSGVPLAVPGAVRSP